MQAVFTEVGGTPTRYHKAGASGPKLLLVHGAGLSSASWLRVIDRLGEHFEVAAPDTLGHGFTQPGDHGMGPPHPAMVEHLGAFVDHLGWDRFHVVGSSFGALLGTLLYFHMPHRVERLVVVSSGSFANTDEELAGSLQEAYANGMSALDDPSYANCSARMQRICYSAEGVSPEMIFMQMTEYALPWAKAAYEQRLRGMMDLAACRPWRVLDRLEQIAVPTLLLWGLNDKRGIHARAEDAVLRIPDARLIAFDRCKHHPHLEHAQRFCEVLTTFLLGRPMDAYGPVI